MENNIHEVGSLSAALSALKPIQYDPLEPTQIMAGVGLYKGRGSLAIGLANYRDESTLIHVGLATGGRTVMANAGLTWKFGNDDRKKKIAERYEYGSISSAYVIQDEIVLIKEENKQLKDNVELLSKENAEMKLQIANVMSELSKLKENKN